VKIYFATHNANKLREISKMLPEGFELLGLDELNLHEEIPETADTIEGNSLMKTQYVFDKHQVACFGDDTGLEVVALNNEPGVYSARYAGPDNDSNANMDKLLKNLEGKPDRTAQFKTVITYIDPDGKVKQFTGIAKGEITVQKSGAKGFGYDPIFRPDDHDLTFAEMSADQKNAISHRGKAFQQFMEYLNSQPS
jgi:XTP/dITP diphosphohydrolase